MEKYRYFVKYVRNLYFSIIFHIFAYLGAGAQTGGGPGPAPGPGDAGRSCPPEKGGVVAVSLRGALPWCGSKGIDVVDTLGRLLIHISEPTIPY